MKKTSRTIVFFGTDDFSLPSLQALIETGYDIGAVVTKLDSISGRGHKIEQPPIKKLAIKHDITVWQPDNLNDINLKIREFIKPLGIVVSFGKIIPKKTIEEFKDDVINIHPSLLPTYRGPSPIESAILNGDKATGITIMKLTPTMDAGPIYYQESFDLSGKENRLSLRHALSEKGADLLINVLPDILSGNLKPQPQDNSAATYCNLSKKTDGVLKPDEIMAIEAERKVRAYAGFPKTRMNLLGHEIIITKAHLVDSANSPIDVVFKDGIALAIDELIAPSGRKMTGHEFLNGYS